MTPTTRRQTAKARSETYTFLRLSTEIQLIIIKHLLPSIESIHAVAKTCRHLYDVALILTVHTFRNFGIDSYPGNDRDWASARTIQFIRYITVTKPHLAQHVKCVTLGRTETDGWEMLDKSRAPKGEELKLYQGLVEQTFTEAESVDWKIWRSEWLEGLATLSEDAEIALLLVVCPNIEQLFMVESDDPRKINRVLDVAGQRSLVNSNPATATGTEGPLHRLRELFLESRETKYGHLSWSKFAKAFQIQSLRSYEVILANGEDYHAARFEALPKRSSNLEEIILRKSCITANVLNAICAVPRALRSFEYTRGVYHMYDEEMMPRHLVDAMIPHATTLEYLHINSEDDWPTGGAPENLCMGVGLKTLTALKQLAAGMQALTGTRNPFPAKNESMNYPQPVPISVEDAPRMIDCLPESLEFLQIHYCGKAVLPQAQELLDACAAGRFPKLQHVRLLFNKELISSDDINLQYDSSLLQLEVYHQSEENRFYDLIQRVGRRCLTPCTRIYSYDLRARWLKYRYHDVARARVNEGVLYEPGPGGMTEEKSKLP
ncbi:hypothetical protein ACHAQH_009134 [Verticillium albo-atrum]